MTYDRERHHRRSIRLQGYDYSEPGAYFVTICTQGRECLLGNVIERSVRVNQLGAIADSCWRELPSHYPYVVIEDFVVMPNHLHGIVALVEDANVGAGLKPAPTRHSLAEVIRGFKTFSTRRINALRETPGARFWQRNYYERIIRNETELERIRQYVIENPERWAEDEYFR